VLNTTVQVTYGAANGHVTGGTGGCAPIDGNLRVKVVQANTGAAIPNAYVMVGSIANPASFQTSFEGLLGSTTPTGPNTCITDSNGYCEFYDFGSNLAGPLMVTGGATGRAYFTIVDAGASDLILPLTERHPATSPIQWLNEETNEANRDYNSDGDILTIGAGLALPIVDLDFFSQGDMGRLMEATRCVSLRVSATETDYLEVPRNFFLPRIRVWTLFFWTTVLQRTLWNLSLDALEYPLQNITLSFGEIPRSAATAGMAAMLAQYDYTKIGYLLNQNVINDNGSKNVTLAESFGNILTINVTASIPFEMDLLAFAGTDYDADLGSGRLGFMSHEVYRWNAPLPRTLQLETSNLANANLPNANQVTYLASVGARWLEDENSRTQYPLTAQQRWAGTWSLYRDNGSGGGPPFGDANATWTVSELLDRILLTFTGQGTFTWNDSAANGIAPHYSVSTVYVDTETYAPPPCIGNDSSMNIRQKRSAKSVQWVIARPYDLTDPSCLGQECFTLPTLPVGWPEQGSGVAKRDGLELRVGSGNACTVNSNCNTSAGETCVDVDQGGPGGLRCAIVTGTNPPNGTTNTVRRYFLYTRAYRLSAEAAFDFDDFAFDDNVLYRTHQTTNEIDFSN
jgi:hypothetical protein